MSAPKPFEQWPTRTAAALDMRAKGWTVPQIATRIGISANAVHGLLSSAISKRGRSGVLSASKLAPASASRLAAVEGGHTVQIILPPRDYARLIDAARREAMTPGEFVKTITLAELEGE